MLKLINKINGCFNNLPCNKIRAGLTPPFPQKGRPCGQILLIQNLG